MKYQVKYKKFGKEETLSVEADNSAGIEEVLTQIADVLQTPFVIQLPKQKSDENTNICTAAGIL